MTSNTRYNNCKIYKIINHFNDMWEINGCLCLWGVKSGLKHVTYICI